jgi:hypothetical protein
MKTNVTMESTDRELFGVRIRQGTKPDFLSVSDLQKAYENARWHYHGWTDKQITNLLQTDTTKERIYHLLFERGLVKTSFLVFTEMVDREGGMVKALKSLGVYKTTGKGTSKTVMADPYIWVLLAMELNPMIYAKVIMWLTDHLIFERIEAGNETKPLNAAVMKLVTKSPEIHPKMHREINIRVFGHHQTGMRNLASAAQLRMISRMETFFSGAVNNGWIKTEDALLTAIKDYQI